VAAAIKHHYTAFDLIEGEAEVALAFRWRGAPSYQRIRAFAEGIVAGMAKTLAKGGSLFVVLDGDIAQTLGKLLRDELDVRNNILVIDGVTLWDFDYVDLGRIRMPSFTVPVTVKSLVFNEDPRALRRRGHSHGGSALHHHHHGSEGHTHE
jgi:ethanolamine utilization protein EutA